MKHRNFIYNYKDDAVSKKMRSDDVLNMILSGDDINITIEAIKRICI